jgi:hypothetical protein
VRHHHADYKRIPGVTPHARAAYCTVMNRPLIWAALGLVLCLGVTATAAGAPRGSAQNDRARFVGYVAGARGPTHTIIFATNDRFRGLVFRDLQRARTRYRVCWNHEMNRARCWTRTTGARGAPSRLMPPMPQLLGDWFAHWYVNGRLVASWHVVFGIA